MSNWKTIHSDFTKDLQKEWENNNFTYNQTQDWIGIGLTPNDCSFAVYLRDVLKYEPEEVLSLVSDIKELKTQYQEYLQGQNEENEASQLIRAMALSLGIFNFSDNPLKGLTDEEAEQYLSTKRLDLKKHFVFNLGKEVMANSEITVADKSGKVASEPLPNVRLVKPLLSEHLTQLFADGHQKTAISFTGKHTNHLSLEWIGDKLNHKINNGEEVYIVFDKSKIKENPSYINQKASSNTQLGELSWPKIVILAVEARPWVRVFQSKKNALRFLREGDTSLFTKELSGEERKLLEQMGVDNSKYEVAELKRMLEYANIAKRSIDKLPFEEGEIKKLIFFSPPCFQDKDCAVVVSDREMAEEELELILETMKLLESPPPFREMEAFLSRIWLLVYERPWQNNGWYLYVKQVKSCSNLEEAEKEANRLVEGLMDENNPYPACEVFDKVGDVFKAFSFDASIEGIQGLKSPWSSKKNPEGYFKPLDVVWVKNTGYFHVGIYLGKDKKGNHKIAQMTRANNDAEITDWSELFGNSSREISRYHVFIPYKQSSLIKEHIAKAVASDEYSGSYPAFAVFGAGNYKKGNCQHFANRCILGLNISNEGTLFKKNSSLRNEIEKTNQHFNSLTIRNTNQKFHQARVKEISECVVVHKPIWEWKKVIELKPTNDCKLQ